MKNCPLLNSKGSRSTKKQLHLITGLNVGGAEMMLLRLLETGLVNEPALEVRVVALSGEGHVAKEIRKLGVEVTCLGMNPSLPRFKQLRELLCIVHQWEPDVIQTWMYHADLVGGWIGSKLDIPVVWGVRRTEFPKFSSIFQRQATTKFRTALIAFACSKLSWIWPAAIICCADSARETHIDGGYEPQKMRVIHNGIDIGKYMPNEESRVKTRKQLGFLEGHIVVGMIARDNPIKDHENFVAAASVIANDYPEVRFLLAGRGIDEPKGRVRSLISSYGLDANFESIGEQNDVPAVLAALDIFCLSSKSEGFPNVLAEAMASGLPAVSTDVGAAQTILGEISACVPASDSEALASSIAKLLRFTKGERARIGAASRKRIQDNFATDIAWNSYQSVYVEAVTASKKDRTS